MYICIFMNVYIHECVYFFMYKKMPKFFVDSNGPELERWTLHRQGRAPTSHVLSSGTLEQDPYLGPKSM